MMGLSRIERLTRDLISLRLSSRDPSIHMPRDEARELARALLKYDWQAVGIESVKWSIYGRTIVWYTSSHQGDRGQVLTFVSEAGDRPRKKIWRA